jgi:hypothetical protein
MSAEPELVAFERPNHPVLRVFPKRFWDKLVAEHGLSKAADLWNGMVRERNEAVRLMEADPLGHGYEPAHWLLVDLLWGWISVEEFCDRAKSRWGVPEEAEIEKWKALARAGAFAQLAKDVLLLGGWRSSKTTYMLKRAVQCLLKYPKALIWVFHENLEAGIVVHQRPVFEMLPKEWKEAGKGDEAYVSFKAKTGFSEASFIGPNKSQMMFKTYGQTIPGMQGFQLGEPEMRPCLGAVCDELVPLAFVDTLAGRCMTWKSVLMRGFTPIMGHTAVVERSVAGARELLNVQAADLADENVKVMPLVLEKVRPVEGDDLPPMLTRTAYFPTRWNLFQDIREVRGRVAGKPLFQRAALLYGKTYKLDTGLFSKLDEGTHGFAPEQLPKEGTDWMACDPAGARNWFMLWGRVDVWGRLWVFEEWPCEDRYVEGVGYPGPWAEEGADAEGKHKGYVAGTGQYPTWGLGLDGYKEQIAKVERWKDALKEHAGPVEEWREENGAGLRIYARVLDGRTAKTPGYASGPETTILDKLADLGLIFLPAEGKDVETGIQLINDRLDFRPGWQSPEEGPKLFISKRCRNLWYCLNHLPKDADRKNPLKDPVDVLRYLLGADPFYMDAAWEARGPRKAEGKLSRLFKAE